MDEAGDGEWVSVRLSDGVLAEIDARAGAAGVDRATVVAALVRRALRTASDDGVDRTQIARRLRMTPAERIATMADEAQRLAALTGPPA